MTTTIQTNQQSHEVASLVIAAQAGDRESLSTLLERFYPLIVSLARRRISQAEEAEELAQEVCIQAMRKLNQLRAPEAFAGWLRQIVHRMAINRLAQRRLAIACAPETLEAVEPFSEQAYVTSVQREEAASVRAGIDRLGTLDRETLEAFYLEGRSLIEMSDAFEAPVGTIKRRLHVARKRLAKELDMLQAV
jgi:RNA polymerase sigma-70 factor, ECF subfamily